MTTNNQGVDTRELALMILLEIERGEKSHIVLRQVLEKNISICPSRTVHFRSGLLKGQQSGG